MLFNEKQIYIKYMKIQVLEPNNLKWYVIKRYFIRRNFRERNIRKSKNSRIFLDKSKKFREINFREWRNLNDFAR